MALKIGIIGLPNVGKSTVLNALTLARAEASNYPFCTIEKNVGIVDVPDARLEKLVKILEPRQVIRDQLHFVDIAGLVEGAHRGEGLGNKFLSHIREVDALIHVVRCFADENVSHVHGEINPLKDLEVVHLELALADLDTIKRRREKITRAAKANPGQYKDELDLLGQMEEMVERGESLAASALDLHSPDLQALNLLTTKAYVVLANVGEEDAAGGGPALQDLEKALGKGRVLHFSARIEEELRELPEGERKEFMTEFGFSEAGLRRLVHCCYDLLDLITFYTDANDILQAWHLPRGAAAGAAAGKIHTDMEKGFIKAEVIHFEDYCRLGSRAGIQEKGLLRIEGRDYAVQDGDVLRIFFKN